MIEQIASRQPPPTGDGDKVLDFVLSHLIELKGYALRYETAVPEAPKDSLGLQSIGEDLAARAEMGREKYGTYLRTCNGRDAGIDLLQELLDAVMYSAQCKMEGKPEGAYFEAILNLAFQVSSTINRRIV